MNVGLLYYGGYIVQQPSVFMAMYSFMNGRFFSKEWGREFSPQFLVQQNSEGYWEKLKPTPAQIKDCMRAINAWYANRP